MLRACDLHLQTQYCTEFAVTAALPMPFLLIQFLEGPNEAEAEKSVLILLMNC